MSNMLSSFLFTQILTNSATDHGAILLLFLVILGGYALLKTTYFKQEKKGIAGLFLLGGTPRENFLISPSRKEGYPVTAMFSVTAAWIALVVIDFYKPELLADYSFFGRILFFLASGTVVFGVCLLKYIFIRAIPAGKSIEASEVYYHEYMQFSRTVGFVLFIGTGLLLSFFYASPELIKHVLKIWILIFTLLRPLYIIFRLRFLIPLRNLLNFSYFCTLETVPAVFIVKFVV